MDKRIMVANWDVMENGLSRMAQFLYDEGVIDRQRLPTNAVLAVIAALYSYIPEGGDKQGKDELLLRRYVWHAFFTDRYENAAATRAYSDFVGLRGIIRGDTREDGAVFGLADVPIFSEHELLDVEELLSAEWPNRASIHGRAVLAVACRLGSLDFSTGERIDEGNIEHRQYHHIYPDALLKEAGIASFLALNCALISDKTNLSIGRKDPLVYLRDRYKWTSESIVKERLQSHLIPIAELANGGYEGLADPEKTEKLRDDFTRFVEARADLMMRAIELLTEGRQVSAAILYEGDQVPVTT